MVRKGRETTRKQYTLRLWSIGGGPLGREGKEKEKEKEKDNEKDNEGDTRDKDHQRERKGDVKKGIG